MRRTLGRSVYCCDTPLARGLCSSVVLFTEYSIHFESNFEHIAHSSRGLSRVAMNGILLLGRESRTVERCAELRTLCWLLIGGVGRNERNIHSEFFITPSLRIELTHDSKLKTHSQTNSNKEHDIERRPNTQQSWESHRPDEVGGTALYLCISLVHASNR